MGELAKRQPYVNTPGVSGSGGASRLRAQNAVPEGALGCQVFGEGGLWGRNDFGARQGRPGARFRGIVPGGRGGQGRPVRAAPRGSLDGPGVQLSPATIRPGPPSGDRWLRLDTADLIIAQRSLSGAAERLGDRPFVRAGAHDGFRPQPDGLNQIDGHATGVGATAFFELASWLCPSLLTRPVFAGSGSRRLAARSRPG
jgi:hypothetical protein